MAKTAQYLKAEKDSNKEPPLLPADQPDSRLTLLLKRYLKNNEIETVWRAYR